MLRVKSRLWCGIATILALAVSATAQAGWGSYGSNGGSWGSSGGSSSYGSTGSWGSHGSSGGSYGRHHHHRHHRSWGSHGSNGGSNGSHGSFSSWGSNGGSSGGSSGGSNGGSSGGSNGGLHQVIPGPMDPMEPAAQPDAKADATKGALKVTVPEDALVYVNGILTKSTGTDRTYVSRGLVSGMKYTYEVRAEAIRNGQKVEETKVVTLKPGDNLTVAFNNLQAAKSAETTLTLNVPAEAKVSLGGNPTNGNGTERTFRTTKLSSDKEWSSYVVQVSIERGGRTLTQEKSITLKAGDNQTLTFDFNDDQIAATR